MRGLRKGRWEGEKAEKEGGSEVREFRRLGVIAGASRGCSDQSEGDTAASSKLGGLRS